MSKTLPEYALNRRRFLMTLLAGSAALAVGDLALPRVARAAASRSPRANATSPT